MANKTITDLTSVTAIDEDDVFVVDEDGTTRKATTAQVRTALSAVPSVKANRDSSIDITNATWSNLTFGATESWDTHSMHDTTANQQRITIPTGWGGIWSFSMQVAWENLTGGIRIIGYNVNGGSDITLVSQLDTTVFFSTEQSATWLLSLSAGNEVNARGYHSQGGNLGFQKGSFSAYWVRPAP